MTSSNREKIFYISSSLHPDTANLVSRFASALARKLAAAQEMYGYSNDWMRTDWMNICRANLLQHLEKGDPRDVAAYCAFLWHHGESTIAPQPEPVNQQMLDVARAILADDLLPYLPVEYVTNVRRAIAAAEAAADIDLSAIIAVLPGSEQTAPDNVARDAARYRWLREQHWSDSALAVVSDPKANVSLGTYCPSRELLDAAIDAMLAAAPKPEQPAK